MARNPVTRWDFTLKEEGTNFNLFRELLKCNCKKWVFQLEEGEETGYRHYQGRVSLINKSRKGFDFPGIHWSVTSNANRDNDFYVMKSETRIDGPWSDEDPDIPWQYRDITLYAWQEFIANDVTHNRRNINVLVNPSGNIGKSVLCGYADCHEMACSLPIMDSHKDYMRMVMDYPKARLYLVDMPKALSKTECRGFWAAMECIKNGCVYDDRYKSRKVHFDAPNIWVFTNTFPDRSFLSDDRWLLWNVTDGRLVRINFDGIPLEDVSHPESFYEYWDEIHDEDIAPPDEVEDMGYDDEGTSSG